MIGKAGNHLLAVVVPGRVEQCKRLRVQEAGIFGERHYPALMPVDEHVMRTVMSVDSETE